MKYLSKNVKILINNLSRKDHFDKLPIHNGDVSMHATPPGSYPREGPQPSKIPVVLFYISCICCVLGTIMITNSFFHVADEDKREALGTGIAIAAVGVILALIMNVLNKREHDKIVSYVSAKAEEMVNDVNSRQRFNKEYANHIGTEGPYGIH